MGNFLDDLLGKVFKGSGKTPVNYKENFAVKTEDLEEIDAWLDSDEGNTLMNLIYKIIISKDLKSTPVLKYTYSNLLMQMALR